MSTKQIRVPEQLSSETEKLYELLNTEPDFPCVLVLASFLDECLASLLEKRMVPCKASKDLLNGRLSTLSARADIAMSMGLITLGMHENLKCIATIRNKFAHAHLGASFSDQPIADLCRQLTLPHVHNYASNDPSHTDPWHLAREGRNRFVICGIMLANRLIISGLDQVHIELRQKGWEQLLTNVSKSSGS